MSMTNETPARSTDPTMVPAIHPTNGCWVTIRGERFYRISDVDRMQPFLMSIVSDSDHWLFISSNGGLAAGRTDADHALFPYCTEDKIQDNAGNTGPKTIIWVEHNSHRDVWEPFSNIGRDRYETSTNLYKNVVGNKVLFEEINHDLGLEFRALWTTSDAFGFVRQTELTTTRSTPVRVNILDGIQNILPWGTNDEFQRQFSCLGDAYKQNELETDTGLGIYSYSSIPGDSAEPSEALRATVCWSTCPKAAPRLVSSTQVDTYRKRGIIQPEQRVCGRRGAYFVHNELTIESGVPVQWLIVADVARSHSAITELNRQLTDIQALTRSVQSDIDSGTRNLTRIVASADGLQLTGDHMGSAHHFSNVLFNVMRGGTFGSGYRIPVDDLKQHIQAFNRRVFDRHTEFLSGLDDEIDLPDLIRRAEAQNDPHLVRLVRQFLPLSFSRRHGDPSRPWNRFSIRVSGRDGSRTLGYEGNWRDIFQNWEALCHSFPEFTENVIFKFVNNSTADGYNPYRITNNSYEWEIPDPDQPWANIGYWGDHQLIYLLKLLELSRKVHPDRLNQLLTEDLFVYADVPYDIKKYEDLLKDPKTSIVYNTDREQAIAARESSLGLDGRYLVDRSGAICRANLTEKLLVPLLAKVSNFIPGAGFWMNTQRPEWNDANNALAGYGVSMVTLYYARRFVSFCRDLIGGARIREVQVHTEVETWFTSVRRALEAHQAMLESAEISDCQRRDLLDGLGAAGSTYRATIYRHGISGETTTIDTAELGAFADLLERYFDHTIALNRRPDGLFHAYNVMTTTPGGVSVGRLQEMLEGQVAVLSSGCLQSDETVAVLTRLRESRMFREDQASYTLYPDKRLPGFLEKNVIPPGLTAPSELINRLLSDKNRDLIERDVDGNLHFNSCFHNIRDIETALERLASKGYDRLVKNEWSLIAEIFESVFNHRQFTGRSGTFYGYEGLGCIYWHMVSKLLLAVQERCLAARDTQEHTRRKLAAAYFDIRRGLGFNKSPHVYGAFPADPYSHTPSYAGARQPGMTGQVKEEIITRWAELGLILRGGRIGFDPMLLRKKEFLTRTEIFRYIDVLGDERSLEIGKGALVCTLCQVPFVVQLSADSGLVVRYADGTRQPIPGNHLDPEASREIFTRTGNVARVDIFVAAGDVITEPADGRGETSR